MNYKIAWAWFASGAMIGAALMNAITIVARHTRAIEASTLAKMEYVGAVERYERRRKVVCDECHGTGKVKSGIKPFDEYDCPICGGSGKLVIEVK